VNCSITNDSHGQPPALGWDGKFEDVLRTNYSGWEKVRGYICSSPFIRIFLSKPLVGRWGGGGGPGVHDKYMQVLFLDFYIHSIRAQTVILIKYNCEINLLFF
jgi:hypothetical protein